MPRRSLSDLFPPPREIRIAGRSFRVGELTLGELAEADAPRAAVRPDPLAGVRDLLHADEIPPSERHRFDRALALADGEDEDEGEGGGGTAEDLDAEVKALLRAALRRHHPDVAGDEAAIEAMYGAMTRAEYRALAEAAHRPDPMDVLCRALDRFCGTGAEPGEEDGGAGGGGTDWFELVDRVARSHGMSYATIREMTVTQFANALTCGKPVEGRQSRAGEDAAATFAKWQRWLAGDDVGAGGDEKEAS